MLKGKKILFTGLVKNKSDFEELTNNEAEIIFFPTIKIVELTLTENEKTNLNNASKYDYLIFTSKNAVKSFHNKFDKNITEINNSFVQVIGIGEKTKVTAENYGLKIDLVPLQSSSNSVNEFLSKAKVNNKKILIPGSKLSNNKLQNSLLQKGATVDFIPVYDTVIPTEYSENKIEEIKRNFFDLIVFTSPSTFNNFVKIINIKNVQDYFKKTKIAAIGPVTKLAIEKFDLEVTIEPYFFNIKSLIEEVIKKFNNK